MAPILPSTRDRSQVFVKTFSYENPQDGFVVPLSGAEGVAGQTDGQVTLVAGVGTVANTAVTASSRVIYSRKTLGGTLGNTSVVVTAGVGFVITSSSVTETAVYDYLVLY